MSDELEVAFITGEMAHLLYDFLPYSGNERWTKHVNFCSVARKVGVERHWQKMSKEPGIAHLLHNTIKYNVGCFEKLIVEIVHEGIIYRKKQGNPIKRSEIERLNQLIFQVGFKFPDLWSEKFLTSLEGIPSIPNIEAFAVGKKVENKRIKLESLREKFYSIAKMQNRQIAGFEFEKFLNELFQLFDLSPHLPFRVKGEQIDGSLELNNEIYLIEAKWVSEPLPKEAFDSFHMKVERKSSFTRGVFIALNGFSSQANQSFSSGLAPRVFIIDGYDISRVLESEIELDELLRKKMRRLAELGEVLSRI